jgi:hypothetical protein
MWNAASRIGGDLNLSLISAALGVCVLLGSLATPAVAQETRSLRVVLHANEGPNFKEFGLSGPFSQQIIGTAMPSTYTHTFGKGDDRVKSTAQFFARWKDEQRQFFGISVSAFSEVEQIDIYFYRYNITDAIAHSFGNEKCRHTSGGDPETLFSRYFACKDLVAWLDERNEFGTSRFYTALRGWFYAAWHLFRLGGTEVRIYDFDSAVRERMEAVLKRHAELGTYPGNIDIADVRNKLKEYLVADIYLINKHNQLRNDTARIADAKTINDYLISKFPEFQKATGTTIVRGVSMDLLKRNDAFLFTKATELGVRF